MKKKYLVIIIFLLVIIVGCYLYLRFSILKHGKIPEKTSKAESVIDLRPAIIAKLQHLVKVASDSLYNLEIGRIEPDVLDSKIDISNVSLVPDTAVLKKLDITHNAPDDVFRISFHFLHIDGIGVKEFLFNKKLDLHSVHVDDPVIKVYHTKKSYNEAQRRKADSTTLYQKIMKQFSSVAVSNVVVMKGTLSLTDVQQKNTLLFKDVSFNINDILIDSTTQYDKSRFLFAKQAEINSHNYVFRTPDSLYLVTCRSINILTHKRTLTAIDVQYAPRVSKQEFQKKHKYAKDMYTLKVPKLVFAGVDWWKLANKESFIASQVDAYNPDLYVYLNTGLPHAPITSTHNFPSQQVMEIKSPVLISKLNLHGGDVTYQEYEPKLSQSGVISFNDIKASAENITNVKKQVKKIGRTTIRASAMFKRKVPMNAVVTFDLSKVKTGSYTAEVRSGALDTAIINPFAEPMSLFKLKSGTIKSATVHIDGNNASSNGKIEMLYDDLKIMPLKKSRNSEGQFKKKGFLGAIANVFLVKNSNPGMMGKVRTPQYTVARGKSSAFTEMTWKIILTGILKTVGLPAKIAE